jgi:hypothetical protein
LQQLSNHKTTAAVSRRPNAELKIPERDLSCRSPAMEILDSSQRQASRKTSVPQPNTQSDPHDILYPSLIPRNIKGAHFAVGCDC